MSTYAAKGLVIPFENIPLINDIPLDTRIAIARVIIAIVAFFILWLLRNVVTGLIAQPIQKLVDKTDTDADDLVLDAVKKVTSYFIIGIGLLLVVLILGLGGGTEDFVIRVAITFGVFALFHVLFTITSSILQSPERVRRYTPINIEPALMPVTRISTKILIVVLGVLAVAQIWNFNFAGLLAGIGLTGLAISLAAKEALDDVMGFLIIVGDDIYVTDEYIISPQAEGIVEKIGLRSTRVRQLNQGLVTVPNSEIANSPVTNWSRLDKRWFNFMVGVTYDSTPEQIEKLVYYIRKMLEHRKKVDNDSIVVLFTEYNDSSLNVLLRCYINIEDWTEAKQERHAVNLEIMRIISHLDMSIAFPSRSLYLEQVPPAVLNMNGHNSKRREPEISRHNARAGSRTASTFKQGDSGNMETEATEMQEAGEGDGDA